MIKKIPPLRPSPRPQPRLPVHPPVLRLVCVFIFVVLSLLESYVSFLRLLQLSLVILGFPGPRLAVTLDSSQPQSIVDLSQAVADDTDSDEKVEMERGSTQGERNEVPPGYINKNNAHITRYKVREHVLLPVSILDHTSRDICARPLDVSIGLQGGPLAREQARR